MPAAETDARGERGSTRRRSRVRYAVLAVLFVNTAATAPARGFVVRFALRTAIGVFEAPAFPANGRLTASWFPRRERGEVTSVRTAGEHTALVAAITSVAFFAQGMAALDRVLPAEAQRAPGSARDSETSPGVSSGSPAWRGVHRRGADAVHTP